MSDIVDELMHVQFVQYAEYRNGWTSRTLAKKAADEIIRLNRELEDTRNAALKEAAKVASIYASEVEAEAAALRKIHDYARAAQLASEAEGALRIAAAIRQMKEKEE